MAIIVCSTSNIKVYKDRLTNTYRNHKIHYKDLKSCISNVWTNVQFIDVVVQNNQFNLHICCDSNAKKYIDTFANNNKVENETYNECDESFVTVARELNEWHIGHFTIERLSALTNGYNYDTEADIDPSKSVVIPLGVPISRIIEFYGVKGLDRKSVV